MGFLFLLYFAPFPQTYSHVTFISLLLTSVLGTEVQDPHAKVILAKFVFAEATSLNNKVAACF